MAKKLNTTVHLTDDKGREHTFGPNDELPGWAESQLTESWGEDRDDLWDGGTAPEELSVEEALKQGTPPPDRGPVDQENPEGRDAEAIELGQQAQPEAAEDADDEAKPRGRGRK